MQIHSLTVGGTDRKAELPCLLQYTKCCATFACHRKCIYIFFFIMASNTRVPNSPKTSGIGFILCRSVSFGKIFTTKLYLTVDALVM